MHLLIRSSLIIFFNLILGHFGCGSASLFRGADSISNNNFEGKMFSLHTPSDTRQHTSQPIVTGTTVLGIKYCDGVMLAADTLASYGSMARYKDVRRLEKVGESTLIGASGEISDFQSIKEMLQSMHQEDVNQVKNLFLFHSRHDLNLLNSTDILNSRLSLPPR